MDQAYCEVKSRQILPPDCMRCPVPRGALVHKTLNEQRNLECASWPYDCTEGAGASGGATVLQVASDLTIHAQSHNLPRHPRSAEADRAPSPFESLLDDSAPVADRSAPPPDDKASHATARNPYVRQATVKTARPHLRTTTMPQPSLRMRRTLMGSDRRRMRSNVKSGRMPK
jgi:hypothetical protein